MKSKKKPDKKQISPQLQENEIEELNRRIQEEAPARGYAPPVTERGGAAFRSLALSEATLRGLEEANYSTMTAIQNACIPHALAGRDILGAAKTGSGKTLAFLVPLLEKLYRERFTAVDGPGAVVMVPTRELAVQIFQVLQAIGKYHQAISVGVLIGGGKRKDYFIQEQERIGTTNIIIATPGRFLQHLEQTANLDLGQVRVLVLDEADRILDMGFRDQLVRILDYMPTNRQTMLFSATQTRDVSSLATLSLNKPEYVGVHDKEKTSTPDTLQQSYIVVPLQHKLDAIYSFVKSHLKTKSIVFMATCAQVRHAWEMFCSLRPGIPIMALHGRLSQAKRTQIYFDYLKRPNAVLFSTDISARGLDWPNIDWVVQMDAPEDRDMYIHRAGRTARYRSGGKSLLILTPAEEQKGFIQLLENGKIHLKKLSINPSKTVVVTQRASSLVASNVTLNDLAKRAFESYVRCIYLMPQKDIFDVKDLDLDGFSKSLGLASTPNLRFLKNSAQERSEARKDKNVNKKLQKLKEQIKIEKLAKKLEKLGQSADEAKELAAKKNFEAPKDVDESDDDELLVSKGREHWNDDGELPDVYVNEVTKSRKKTKILIGSSNSDNKHVVFNDDGDEEDAKMLLATDSEKVTELINKDKEELAKANSEYLDKVRQRLQSNKELDHAEEKERIRQKHKKRRLKEKADREGEEGGVEVMLGSDDQGEDDDRSASSHSNEDSGSVSDSDSSSDSSSMDEPDLKAQEEMALSLIRGKQA